MTAFLIHIHYYSVKKLNFILHYFYITSTKNCNINDIYYIKFFHIFTIATSVAVSAWTLVAISCERYYAICHPLSSRRWQTLKHAYKLIGLIWFGSFLFMSPIAVLSKLIPTSQGKFIMFVIDVFFIPLTLKNEIFFFQIIVFLCGTRGVAILCHMYNSIYVVK